MVISLRALHLIEHRINYYWPVLSLETRDNTENEYGTRPCPAPSRDPMVNYDIPHARQGPDHRIGMLVVRRARV